MYQYLHSYLVQVREFLLFTYFVFYIKPGNSMLRVINIINFNIKFDGVV
jgi:hypothetical protein